MQLIYEIFAALMCVPLEYYSYMNNIVHLDVSNIIARLQFDYELRQN